MQQLAPHLLAIPGCGVLGAAAILGETAGAARFKSKGAFAHFNGTAPIPVWSSNKVRVRLNRGGNRTVNSTLHMTAVTQTGGDGEGAAYYARQLAAGKTVKEALRLLKRRISDRVYRALLTYEPPASQPAQLPTALAAIHQDLLRPGLRGLRHRRLLPHGRRLAGRRQPRPRSPPPSMRPPPTRPNPLRHSRKPANSLSTKPGA
ncbi:IS110 family transposase [Streptomyces sp. UNOC14_S4]|nr:IS110 family transposase [Streptomyces sp. UNOC14_S4]